MRKDSAKLICLRTSTRTSATRAYSFKWKGWNMTWPNSVHVLCLVSVKMAARNSYEVNRLEPQANDYEPDGPITTSNFEFLARALCFKWRFTRLDLDVASTAKNLLTRNCWEKVSPWPWKYLNQSSCNLVNIMTIWNSRQKQKWTTRS